MEDSEAQGREISEGERLAFALAPVHPALRSKFKNKIKLYL